MSSWQKGSSFVDGIQTAAIIVTLMRCMLALGTRIDATSLFILSEIDS